jgi:hypothetical protein
MQTNRIKLHHKLELLGLLLLLIAAGTQIVLNDLSQLATNAEFYRLNDKLDHFWAWNHDLAYRKFQMDDKLLKKLNDMNDRFFADEHFTEPVAHQAKIMLWIYISFYVLGSIAFIGGRYAAFASCDRSADV